MTTHKTTCIECGSTGTLEVTEGRFIASGMKLEKDGYDFNDVDMLGTEDEMVYCQSCEDLRALADYTEEV